MPRLRQHVNLLSIDALKEFEVRIAELKVIESELDTNEMQRQVVRGKFAVVGWAFRPVIQLAEQVLHQTLCPLYLLVDTRFLSHDGSLSARD